MLTQWRTFVCFMIGFMLPGCNPDGLPPADLVVVNGKEPESLDPAIISGQAEGRIVNALFEGLTRYDPRTALPEPGLAQSWTISPDQKELLFDLRPGLQWSDGTPLTTEDVVYSWHRILKPETACDYANILFQIKNAEAYHRGTLDDFSQVGIEAVNEQQLKITLIYPTPYFLELCAFFTLRIVPRHAIEQHGNHWLTQAQVPSSGAYQLDHWRLNDRIRLVKNPRYWDHPNVRTDVVDILPTSNANTALNLYENGQVDIVWDKELVPTELVSLLRDRPDFHVADFLGTYFLRVNTTRPPFNDARVRQALALAIDRRQIVERITGAGEAIATHLVPKGVLNYTSPEGFSFDPLQARKLLAESGFPQGQGFPSIEYLFNSSKMNEQIAVEIQSMWDEHLGIKTTLRQLEWKSYLQDQQGMNYDVSRSSWIGDYTDPTTFLDVFISTSGNNRTGWASADYDRLLEQTRESTDPDQRLKLLAQAESILVAEQVPAIPIYFYVSMEYFDPNAVGGIFPNIRAEHPLRVIHRITESKTEAMRGSP